jgi:HEAT repeat protein
MFVNLSEGDRAVRKLLGLSLVLVFASASAANVDDLVKKLSSKDNEVRRAAAKELGELGKDAKPAVKPLIKALGDSDRFVRRFAAEALGSIGPDAKEAIPALSKLLNDSNQPVRQAAIKSIGKMGDAAIPALTKALSGTSDVQDIAITALGQLGSSAVEALSGAIKNPKMDASLRRKAVAAVIGLDSTEARKAVPALAAAVKNRKATGQGRDVQQLRIESIKALGTLAGKDDTAAVGALESITKDPKLRDNNPLKRAATAALKQIQDRK